MVKFGTPKVILLSLEVPEIPAGDTVMIKWRGKKLSESTIANSLPVLGCIVSNNSTSDIRVILNEMTDTSIIVVGAATQAWNGYPMIDIEIENLSDVAVINAGDIKLNIMNDVEECLRFEQAKKLGVVPYV